MSTGVTMNLDCIGAERRWIQDSHGTAEERYMKDIVDEVRISSINRTAAWIKFEHRNMSEAYNELTWGLAEEDGEPNFNPFCWREFDEGSGFTAYDSACEQSLPFPMTAT